MNRSLLFIPANSPAMLQNADVFGADAVIFDLEDAVSDSEKDAARILLANYLNIFPYEKNFEVIVRINSFDFMDLVLKDLRTLPLDKIDAILLPKASIETINQLNIILDEYETRINKKIKVIALIELAASLLEVNEIAKLKRISGLFLGAEDLSADMELIRTIPGDEILLARSMIVLAAKANKLEAIDTPFTDTRNIEGLAYDINKAKTIGMNAKSAIHPNQINLINELLSPSIDEIKYSKKVLELAKQAELDGKGAFSYQNKMIDKPILDRAQKVLDKVSKWDL